MVMGVNTGGTGARPQADGLSATAFPSGVRGMPVEITETDLAGRRAGARSCAPDSGGAGRQRGGLGQIIEIEAQDGAPFGIWAALRPRPASRRAAATAASPAPPAGSGSTMEPALAGKGYQEIPAGRRLIVETPGGGGYGAPAERDPEALARDRRADLMAPAATRGERPV